MMKKMPETKKEISWFFFWSSWCLGRGGYLMSGVDDSEWKLVLVSSKGVRLSNSRICSITKATFEHIFCNHPY